MKKTLQISKQILFVLVVAVSVVLILLSFAPRIAGYAVCAIHDKSMEPEFPVGSYVLGEKVPFETIQDKDVLIFADPETGSTFIRRVEEIWTEKEQFVTKGDSADEYDPMTTGYSCVVGRVEHTIPNLGYPSVWVHTVTGKVILALLYIFWISVEIESRRVSKRREKSA